MKTKYKYSIERIYFYCRWSHGYPPDDWCILGVNKWWHGSEMIRYSICFFGLEVRVNINRKFIQER